MRLDAVVAPLALLAVALPFLFSYSQPPVQFWPLWAAWACAGLLALLMVGRAWWLQRARSGPGARWPRFPRPRLAAACCWRPCWPGDGVAGVLSGRPWPGALGAAVHAGAGHWQFAPAQPAGVADEPGGVGAAVGRGADAGALGRRPWGAPLPCRMPCWAVGAGPWWPSWLLGVLVVGALALLAAASAATASRTAAVAADAGAAGAVAPHLRGLVVGLAVVGLAFLRPGGRGLPRCCL